ncbi:MAG: stage III sporulation protein AF [Bacillota bacterium]|nr:stage III sporulation protein AF [Bacillota bacterium]
MAALWGWLRNIVLLLLLILSVELLLPRSTFRQYLRLVAGMILVLAVLEPVLAWLTAGGPAPAVSRAGSAAARTASALAGGTLPGNLAHEVQLARDRQVQEAFRERVAAAVRDLLVSSGTVSAARVEVLLEGLEITGVRVRVRSRAGSLAPGEGERLGDTVARYLGIPRDRVSVGEG